MNVSISLTVLESIKFGDTYGLCQLHNCRNDFVHCHKRTFELGTQEKVQKITEKRAKVLTVFIKENIVALLKDAKSFLASTPD